MHPNSFKNFDVIVFSAAKLIYIILIYSVGYCVLYNLIPLDNI